MHDSVMIIMQTGEEEKNEVKKHVGYSYTHFMPAVHFFQESLFF
jgi:hypothetical protein